MFTKFNRNKARKKRHFRVRKSVFGSPERPRLCVFRSLNHIYAQVIDDTTGNTLVAASSVDKELQGQLKAGGNIAAAQAVGKLIAQRALDKGVTTVVFDRSGNKFHGRVKALADSAREAGLQF